MKIEFFLENGDSPSHCRQPIPQYPKKYFLYLLRISLVYQWTFDSYGYLHKSTQTQDGCTWQHVGIYLISAGLYGNSNNQNIKNLYLFWRMSVRKFYDFVCTLLWQWSENSNLTMYYQETTFHGDLDNYSFYLRNIYKTTTIFSGYYLIFSFY